MQSIDSPIQRSVKKNSFATASFETTIARCPLCSHSVKTYASELLHKTKEIEI
jgi:hypothetical protein